MNKARERTGYGNVAIVYSWKCQSVNQNIWQTGDAPKAIIIISFPF